MSTCAAYLDSRGLVAIAVDTCATGAVQYTGSEKLVRVGDLWVAACGDASIVRFLRSAEVVPPTYDGVGALSDALHAWWRARGGGKVDDGGAWCVDATLIAVASGQPPWLIGVAGHVAQPVEGYIAIGSGAQYATGALWLHRHHDIGAEAAVTEAIEAAGAHDPFTRGCLTRGFEP